MSAAIDVTPGLDDVNLPLSFVDWLTALDADLPASSTERQMLSIAAELAGFDSGWPLGELITGLDERNTALVARAVVHASRGRGFTADGPIVRSSSTAAINRPGA